MDLSGQTVLVTVVGPGGPEAVGKLASRGPGALLDLAAGFAFRRDRE